MSALSPIMRRILALAPLALLLVLGAFAVNALVLKPAAEMRHTIAQKERLLQAMQVRAAETPLYKQQLVAYREALEASPLLFTVGNANLVEAQIQQTLGQLAAAEGGQTLSIRRLSTSEAAGLESVKVSSEIRMPLNGLEAFLSKLERTRPAVRIESLDIRKAPYGGRPQSGENTDLSLRMTVEGFRVAP